MTDIQPKDIPSSLLDIADASYFFPGELAVAHDIYLRRQVAAILTAAREQIACYVEGLMVSRPERMVIARCIREDWLGETDD